MLRCTVEAEPKSEQLRRIPSKYALGRHDRVVSTQLEVFKGRCLPLLLTYDAKIQRNSRGARGVWDSAVPHLISKETHQRAWRHFEGMEITCVPTRLGDETVTSKSRSQRDPEIHLAPRVFVVLITVRPARRPTPRQVATKSGCRLEGEPLRLQMGHHVAA